MAARSRKKKILMHVGGPYHDGQAAAKIFQAYIEKNAGRYKLDVTEEMSAFGQGLSNYDALVVFSMGEESLSASQEKALTKFVEAGGALVGIHCATCQFPKSKAWGQLLGAQFKSHPPQQRFPVEIADWNRPPVLRVSSFEIHDELYLLKNIAPDIQVHATTHWQGEDVPLIWTRTQGQGRIYYNALGHGPDQWRRPRLLKSLLRGLDWACGVEHRAGPIRCAMHGYGGSFGMGRRHSEEINNVPGLKAVAACDIDRQCLDKAQEDFPYFRVYTDPEDLVGDPDVDLVVNILPHNLHAPWAIRMLQAGKHVVLEKPFCLTLEEADEMIDQARQNKRMLTCYHNRRLDGDYLTLRNIVESGQIGEIFQIVCGRATYNRPRAWWRSRKEVSGGSLYDWGAHFTDWVLGLVGSKVQSVQGFYFDKVWSHVSNEDHTQAVVRFASGAMADICISSISAASRPRWRICGTRGAILDDGSVEKGCKVFLQEEGQMVEKHVKWQAGEHQEYYVNLADHLLCGDELLVKPEEARRVIGIIQYAEKSSQAGESLALPGE
jgi:predicted dehydrogenase